MAHRDEANTLSHVGALRPPPGPAGVSPLEQAAARAELPKGTKLDGGKARWSLLPWRALEQVVDVLEYGARKYSVDNWQLVPDARRRYFDAAMRHIIAHEAGELTDIESGKPHLAHAACCVLYLLWFDITQPQPGQKGTP